MSLFRITENDNPSNRVEEEWDAVSVVDGHWVFLRGEAESGARLPSGCGVSDYTVEIEQHGGVWQKVEPGAPLPD